MVKIVLFEKSNNSEGTSIEVKVGQSLMKAAVGANIEGVAVDLCHVSRDGA